MKTLRNHVRGEWHEARSGFTTLVDPCTEQEIARASSEGVDFGAALEFTRGRGGPALRELTLGQRGAILVAMSRALGGQRDELINLSLENTGTTRKDAKFDIDGAIHTLAHYGALGEAMGDRLRFLDGDGLQLGRSARFWGQHVLVPIEGAAVQINAFNFPAWGFAEKAACALLAGVPVITKPATSSAWVAERCVEIVLGASLLPAGALSLICGSVGDLLSRLGSQDAFAFTGSATTARKLRAMPNLLDANTRVNLEADSLNAAVLGPDVKPGEETWAVFLRDVTREMTQKSGQKCTAVRRILVPRPRVDEAADALVESLGEVVTGNPRDGSVTMGPLATASQLESAVAGVAKLGQAGRLVHGSGKRVDGVGNPRGKGFFFGPTLLRTDDASRAGVVHTHEVFGPVATLMPYDGSPAQAAAAVGLGGGTLVTSVYSDDRGFLADYLTRGAASTGRLYVGSEKVAAQLPGSGVAMPQLLHGGPGRAGAGVELGGMRGVSFYLQCVALSGDRALVERLAESTRE